MRISSQLFSPQGGIINNDQSESIITRPTIFESFIIASMTMQNAQILFYINNDLSVAREFKIGVRNEPQGHVRWARENNASTPKRSDSKLEYPCMNYTASSDPPIVFSARRNPRTSVAPHCLVCPPKKYAVRARRKTSFSVFFLSLSLSFSFLAVNYSQNVCSLWRNESA